MDKQFEQFIWAWLPPASYYARSKMKSDADAKRFLAEAWDACRQGKAAVDFGQNWK